MRDTLVSSPGKGSATGCVSRVDSERKLLRQDVEQQQGIARMNTEMERVEALLVLDGGVCAVADQQMAYFHVSVSAQPKELSKQIKEIESR